MKKIEIDEKFHRENKILQTFKDEDSHVLFEVTKDKTKFLPLLELADELTFIKSYLKDSKLYVLCKEQEVIAAIVTSYVSGSRNKELEIKNLAIAESYQNQGLGSEILNYFLRSYFPQEDLKTVIVKTDEFTASFYEKQGFLPYKRIENYFPEQYGHPVIDKGRELFDQISLTYKINKNRRQK